MTFSLGKWLGRDAGKADEGHRGARKLVDRGIAAQASGDFATALRHYRDAVAADPHFAPAHLNLGIALQATGDPAAAIASYESALRIDAGYAAAHYNLARAYLLRGQSEESESSFRSALSLGTDFPEAWVGLASALEMLGRDDEALEALAQANAQRSDCTEALVNASVLLQKLGRFEAAAASDHAVIELEPENAGALCRLGVSLHKLGRLDEAAARFGAALLFQPDLLEAKFHLATVLQAKGRTKEALRLLFDAVADAPSNESLRMKLVSTLLGIRFDAAGTKEREILRSLCEDDNVSMAFLDGAIIGLIKADAGFALLRDSTDRGDDPFARPAPAVAAFLRDPLLLAALPRMTVCDAEVERVLTHVRRWLVLRFVAADGLADADPAVPLEFLCAMARQCFFSGFAFWQEDDERSHAADLRDALSNALDDATSSPPTLEWGLAVAALHGSLHTLRGHERLIAVPAREWSDAFRPIPTEQIADRLREREIADGILPITAIDDRISRAVRAQYEENPYPRWVTVPAPGIETIENLYHRLCPDQPVRARNRPVPILVAGCGTGHHPIQVARAYPDTEILAVDLSLTSLAYAIRMTERFGLTNVAYRQADILKLGELGQQFTIVECCGVLHHLDDPLAGWRALLDVLEPDGLMKIALYSETARRGIRAARDVVSTLNVDRDADGIRACRSAIMQLPEGHPARDVMTFRDFYTLDGCRDLIMHVQECQFTIPRIASSLDGLGLRLLEIECPAPVQTRFAARFPGAAATDLEAWHRFELENPDTFRSMYPFWCCRKATNEGIGRPA